MSRAFVATAIDWKTMPVGKEKYQAYLASREWAVLKAAVRERSGGTCEYCHCDPGTQTHHQTYARIYAERLEDLLHVCEPCHLYLSGKLPDDPRITPSVAEVIVSGLEAHGITLVVEEANRFAYRFGGKKLPAPVYSLVDEYAIEIAAHLGLAIPPPEPVEPPATQRQIAHLIRFGVPAEHANAMTWGEAQVELGMHFGRLGAARRHAR